MEINEEGNLKVEYYKIYSSFRKIKLKCDNWHNDTSHKKYLKLLQKNGFKREQRQMPM